MSNKNKQKIINNVNKNTVLKNITLYSENIAYQEGIVANEEVLKELEESRKKLEDVSIELMELSEVAFQQKSKTIKELRSWRTTMENEAKYAQNANSLMLKNINPEKIRQLKEFLSLLKEINEIQPKGILENILKV